MPRKILGLFTNVHLPGDPWVPLEWALGASSGHGILLMVSRRQKRVARQR